MRTPSGNRLPDGLFTSGFADRKKAKDTEAVHGLSADDKRILVTEFTSAVLGLLRLNVSPLWLFVRKDDFANLAQIVTE